MSLSKSSRAAFVLNVRLDPPMELPRDRDVASLAIELAPCGIRHGLSGDRSPRDRAEARRAVLGYVGGRLVS
jgi:hypothetical protein